MSLRTTKPTIRPLRLSKTDQPVHPPSMAGVLFCPSLDSQETERMWHSNEYHNICLCGKRRITLIFFWCFTSLSTLFKPYRDNGRVCAMRLSLAEFRHQRDSNPGPHKPKLAVLTTQPPGVPGHSFFFFSFLFSKLFFFF